MVIQKTRRCSPFGALGLTVADDGWTISTVDGATAAPWENTVAITEQGPWGPAPASGTRCQRCRRSSGADRRVGG
ncbi:hypothetical protein [Micromonospora palomenae]|uniref:hypothetical protein n=1 Tax=Micromonospora palomenae TaxID=1461247 RepID=UPI003F8BD958